MDLPNKPPAKFSYFILEPIALLYTVGLGIFVTASTPGTYYKICYNQYKNNASVDCLKLQETKSAEQDVQQKAVVFNMVLMLSGYLPGVVINLVLGAVGDKHGRKPVLLFGIVATSLFYYGYVVELALRW